MMVLSNLAYSIRGILDYISLFGELFFITSCLATIIYITTKNQYISYLAAGPIYFALAHFFYQTSHLVLVIIAMSIQALVILFIQKRGLLGKLATKTQAPRAE
ncbi:hypothetical protein [Planococcus maitriensis]|uniref:Uncharacterized protein n=1 Tax=Planococcus maitriensis TaxID=221799 RepID=A0A365K9X8_9BACL|nr:hypothetical protein [Planococcus maitriensis]RAZ69161.1 hypothetical protein DP119_00405 [Planococcus maitriensis]